MNDFIPTNFESNISKKIDITRDKLKRIVQDIVEVDFQLYELPIHEKPQKIAALDGGGYSQDLVGVTIVPSRAAGAIFEPNKDIIWIEKNDIEILTLEEDPKNFGSLLRDNLEIDIALELLKYKPNIIFLDGSVSNFAYKGIPQSIQYTLAEGKKIDEETLDSRFHELFLKYLRASYKLITSCIEQNVILVGISKDSRANILVKNVFGSKKRPMICDASFIQIKSNGKKGFTKPITFKPEIRDIRKKIWEAAQVFQEPDLQSFYLSYFILKERALPIRVDSLVPQKDRLKEIQEALVTYHDGNGFITPAYLTHKKAHMTSELGERLIGLMAEKVFNDAPEVYNAFLAMQRRDVIQ